MKIIALLFAFVVAGCTGNRLNAETKPTAVALRPWPLRSPLRWDGGHDDFAHHGAALRDVWRTT